MKPFFLFAIRSAIARTVTNLHAEVVPFLGMLVLARLGTFVVCVDRGVPEGISASSTQRKMTTIIIHWSHFGLWFLVIMLANGELNPTALA